MNTFNNLNLAEKLIKNLNDLGYTTPTPIQEKTLPLLLKKQDVIAQAKTGSGKTVAFGIPLLLDLQPKRSSPTALVLAPTRELADQVAMELRKLARYKPNIKILTLCGGSSMYHQIKSLEYGSDVIVGTPGRILDHLSKNSLELGFVKTVVLDEADRMLDMGFLKDIEKILDKTPKDKHTMLFSATYDDEIKEISKELLNNPKEVQIKDSHDSKSIKEYFYEVEFDEKYEALANILITYKPASSIVFCNTKDEVKDVTSMLIDDGFDALDIHGDLDQVQRNETLLQFANQSCNILVATDVASRGLDIKDIEAVINYDIPKESENYTHRIGRTARAGKSGIAISLFTKHEKRKLSALTKEPIFKELKDNFSNQTPNKALMKTLCIHGGKKNKLRAGDILGALTKDIGVPNQSIGKFNIFDFFAYVAVEKSSFTKALKGLQNGKIKGKKFKVWELD